MSIWSKLFGGGNLVGAVGDAIDKITTSDEERLELELEMEKTVRDFQYRENQLIAQQNIAQTEVNKAEAQSGNLFVAGWRPAIGWIGAIALAYQFILYPLLLWLPGVSNPPPPLDSGMLYTIITGMLGIAGMRSYDKYKGTDTKRLRLK